MPNRITECAGALLLASLAAGCALRPESEEIHAVRPLQLHWTKEGEIDRLDLAHMGASIRDLHKSPEARAVAAWQYLRGTMYHYPMRNEGHDDQFDAGKLINVYGYSFCTQQGVTAAALCRAAGLEARVIGVPGHGMYEVSYDGRWHAFCTTAGFFVRTREADGHIASLEEIKADPTLATAARAENRASAGFLPCAGGPEILGEQEGTKDCPYALTYRHYDEQFFADGARSWKNLGKPNRSQHSTWITLRRGEEMRLDWDAAESYVPPKIGERFWPPRHLCGDRDRANPFFEEIRPYARKFGGQVCYRYCGTGRQVWRPHLNSAGLLSELSASRNLRASRQGLLPLDPQLAASAEFEMTSPYAYVAGEISGRARVGPGATFRILFRGSDPEAPWEPLSLETARGGSFRMDLGERLLPGASASSGEKKRRSFTRYCFRVRLEMGGDVEVSELVIGATLQHNWCALPRLTPGRNVFSVISGEVESPAFFEMAWSQGSRTRRLRRRVGSRRRELVVRVDGSVTPRMRYVLLSRP